MMETFSYDTLEDKNMTAPAFPPEAAEKVTTAFIHATAARWSFPRVEIQDRGTFMLISVDSLSPETHEIELPIKKSIARALNQVIPAHSTQRFGNWMVVFFREGKMFETVHPSEFEL